MIRLLLAIMLALGATAPAAADPQPMREREILRERPSGFWTSNRPAQGGRYRWRLLGIGAGLVVITGLFTWRHIRRTSALPRGRIEKAGPRA